MNICTCISGNIYIYYIYYIYIYRERERENICTSISSNIVYLRKFGTPFKNLEGITVWCLIFTDSANLPQTMKVIYTTELDKCS